MNVCNNYRRFTYSCKTYGFNHQSKSTTRCTRHSAHTIRGCTYRCHNRCNFILSLLDELHNSGITILMIEQNARSALEISDEGLVLELGRTRMQGPAADILADPRIGQLFLGGTLSEVA